MCFEMLHDCKKIHFISFKHTCLFNNTSFCILTDNGIPGAAESFSNLLLYKIVSWALISKIFALKKTPENFKKKKNFFYSHLACVNVIIRPKFVNSKITCVLYWSYWVWLDI